MFRQADVDRNRLVTLEELRGIIDGRRDEVIRARFQAVDGDRNETISLAEFLAWQRQLGSLALADTQSTPLDQIIPEALPLPLGSDRDERILASLLEPLSATVIVNANTNYDAGVSLEELLAFQRRRFDAADSDGNGELSIDETFALPRGRPGGPNPGAITPPPG